MALRQLMHLQHTGPIREFHLISEGHKLALSDVDAYLIFVSKHGIQKLTLDLADVEEYFELPYSVFTCSTLTHLKLSRFFFSRRLRRHIAFPEHVSLQLEHSEIVLSEDILTLPMLETLKFSFCSRVKLGDTAFPKLKILSIISSHSLTFHSFRTSKFKSVTHLFLDGDSLATLGWYHVPKSLDEPLNLQSLKIYDLQISVKPISCALCLLRNSPNLYELDIDEAVKVDETSTQSQTTELFSYVSNEQNHVDEALREIRTVRLGKFKGSRSEMYFIEVLLAHSPKLERMIVEQCKESSNMLADAARKC
ncbi:F-box/FBD/LRR-repeat protein At1g13570-like [Lycium barbarum]|uniref:F-box/FBD/LRR-repeat protein At1g13570-like n=1 Tax=Lycium barbarum TaxID=112863 RepID=UPI00293EB373|nr:F-box/FBD/LRR-repeat protein At1g13570-like [Lycium barbarum]